MAGRTRRLPDTGRKAAALIIVLAFIVLLTGLIIAFFSRSILDRQISNSSVNRGKVSSFADGAADAIIGELKQEIVLSSSATAVTSGTIYMPLTPAAMLPQITGTIGITGTGSAAPNNLLKLSGAGQLFYSAAGGTIPTSGSSDEIAVSSTTPSLNGRYLTAAYWNQHYLLPTTSSTDSAPATGSFTPPSWVLVARDGSNPAPATLSSGMLATGTNPVVGRYAFAIYHEGGLLDVNAAGYPSTTGTTQSAYKPALAYADLTRLPGALTPAQIDKMVAWRNYASIPVPGSSFLSPAFTAASGSNYYNAIVSNTTGFLSVSGTALNNNQTDRTFASRQELIKFVESGLGLSGTNLNVLNYLTTFSRGLDQPSFAPLPASATPDSAHRPAVTGTASGGNDAYGGDNVINPAFLTVRAQTSFTRNDGSTAVVGEPLVKKRFSLNRLAWITYAGPITTNGQSYNTNLDPSYVPTLKNVYGFKDAFLLQGTPQNIYNYFGLSWVPDSNNSTLNLWVYNHSGAAPLTTSAGVVPSTIRTLGTAGSNPVSGREPDMVELLRAAINVGAIGKASAATANPPTNPDQYEANIDVLTNEAIIQIFANIIGQYSLDNYPPRILYNDGSLSQLQEFDGTKDLPYFYRVRGGLFKVQESNPAFTASTDPPPTGTLVSGSEGLGVGLQEPEIWDPHSWNTNATPSTLRPTSFRLTAITGFPTQSAPSNPDPYSFTLIPENRYQINYNNNVYQQCPPTAPFGPYTPIQNVSWTQDGTALLFNIPSNRLDLFREPTLLIKPGIPAGSSLRCGPLNYLMASSSTNPMLKPYLSTSGSGGIITTATSCPFYTSNGATDNYQYLGMYMGAFPLAWNESVVSTSTASVTSTTGYIINAFTVPTGNGKPVTYRLQYNPVGSGANVWVTYDTKCVYSQMYNGGINWQSTSGSRRNYLEAAYEIGNDNGRSYNDPRTARMGTASCNWQYNASRQIWEWPPCYTGYSSPSPEEFAGAAAPPADYTGSDANQYAAAQNALWSMRPDTYNGFKASSFPANLGFYQTGFDNSADNAGPQLRPGMWSQNNPAANAGGSSAVGGVVPQDANALCFYADADNVVRRAMAAYVQPSSTDSEQPPVTGGASGEPQSVATSYSTTGVGTPISTEQPSRPIILSRPFRTVGELGYVFSGTPWRNLDVSTPESGFSALLDVFCINDTEDPNGLVAGKVNLNTRQAPVLQAILAGAYEDEYGAAPSLSATSGAASVSVIANALVQRTSDITGALGTGSGPLQNLSEIVGKWTGPVHPANSSITGSSWDGGQSYSGFSGMPAVTGTVAQNPPNLSYILTLDTSAAGYNLAVVKRYRESIMRALSAAGQTRVWNLMIDLVAQTGRYPSLAANASNPLAAFNVEGQQHYWVHVAIDRFTGQIIDKQIEVVKE